MNQIGGAAPSANGPPRGQQTREGKMTMETISRRGKRTSPRERVAPPAELEDERQRWLRATTPPRTRESVQALRADSEETQEEPDVTLAKLVGSRS
jgi:hypothetical protein